MKEIHDETSPTRTHVVIRHKEAASACVVKPPTPPPESSTSGWRSFGGQAVTNLHVPVNMDGPYGTPASVIERAEHAVMVCAGIGVTPFASLLQSIVLRYNASKQTCPECSHRWVDNFADLMSTSRIKKVDFIWVVREHSSIEWFLDILESVEQAQSEVDQFKRFIDVKIYVTSAKTMADLTSFAFVTALDLVHRKTNRDLISGLRNPAIPGRPNWKKVFGDIHAQRKGGVTVFYCGPAELGRQLRSTCEPFGFNFRKEIF